MILLFSHCAIMVVPYLTISTFTCMIHKVTVAYILKSILVVYIYTVPSVSIDKPLWLILNHNCMLQTIQYTCYKKNFIERHYNMHDTMTTIIFLLFLPKLIASDSDVNCGKLPKLNNGKISYSGPTIVGTKAKLSCNGENYIDGPSSRVCKEDGSWSGVRTFCRGKSGITKPYIFFDILPSLMTLEPINAGPPYK